MPELKMQSVSFPRRALNSIKKALHTITEKFKYFVNNIVISKLKTMFGLVGEAIHFKDWKHKLLMQIVDIAFTSLIVSFILMSFTRNIGIWRLLAKGIAITLVMLILLNFIGQIKDVFVKRR